MTVVFSAVRTRRIAEAGSHLNDDRLRRVVEAMLDDPSPQIILAARQERMTVRIRTADGPPVVIKLWQVRSLKERSRRWLHGSKGSREYKASQMLFDGGVATPRPYGFMRLDDHEAFDECMISECIEGGIELLPVLHEVINSGDSNRLDRLTSQVDEITRGCIALGVSDSDHRLGNFLAAPDDRVYRIDLENARFTPAGSNVRRFTRMLSALITSYAWAAHRKPGVADVLAARMLDRCGITGRDRQRILVQASKEVGALSARSGLSTPFGLRL